MGRKILLAIIFLAASRALAAAAAACSCVEYGVPVCAAYWRADAVFAGVVTDLKKVPDAAPNSLPKALVHFIVEDKFRNISASEIDVATLHGTSCDTKFEKGERWLVYAYLDKETGRLEISPCTRTHRIAGMDEDLAYIRGLSQRPPEQSVLGRLTLSRSEPLAGLKVSVVGGGRSFETTTDSEGNFAVSLPKGGAYSVRAFVPYSAEAMSFTAPVKSDPTDEQTVLEYPVEIPPGQCAYNQVEVYRVDLHATAVVSGRVLDESGQPVTRGRVYLVDAAQAEDSKYVGASANIGEDGGFKFEYVAVGSFVLVINPRDEAPGESDAPHPRTFYPGVADRSQASPLVITEGLKVEDLNFRVRGPLSKRVVSGKVLRPDGRPAPGALVSLYNGDRYIRMVKADERGRFELDAYGDFEYRVGAASYGEKFARSETVKVPPTGKAARLVLRLKAEKD